MTDEINRVLIKCPETGESVETVLRLRPSAFEGLKGQYSFRCPRCGKPHSWTRQDAWLESLGPRHM